VDSVIQLRRALHRQPELSGDEQHTAAEIVRFFKPLRPDSTYEGLGGHGLAFVFTAQEEGPTVLLRCELDALPIQETNKTEYCSRRDGVSHKCGHDGHMAILAAVGQEFAANRPKRGKVVLLYQPAEENGEGARAVVKDPSFDEIRPDFAFALHNLPGFPLGKIIVRSGVSNCASCGMVVSMIGKTAHAAQPESGVSPAGAMCELVQGFSAIAHGVVPPGEKSFATVVGARLGKKAFGTTPEKAEVWATLRSETDNTMAQMVRFFEQRAHDLASENGLIVAIDYEDVFNATINSPLAVSLVRQAAGKQALIEPESPFPWSEDFGQITALSEGALVGIGAGTSVPELHNSDYDFPEQLIPLAKATMLRIVDRCLDR